MKMRIVFVICFSVAAVSMAAAQGRTVTNADLARYANERIRAERDLRENYAKLGFSSPEEIERRNASDAKERAELAARLRQERLTSERAMAELEQRRAEQARYGAYIRSRSYIRWPQDNYPGFWVYSYGFGGYVSPPNLHGPAWRADASGVVYEPGGRSSHIWTPVFGPRRRR